MTEIEWLREFSDNLNYMMHKAHMSQRELAKKTGLNVSTINRYVTSQMVPSCIAIVNISHALNCDIGELIDFGKRISL